MPIARQGKSITGSWEGKSITGSWEGKSITGSWARLSQFSNSKPPFPVSTMLLLTNGTVMCQEAFTNVNDGKKNFPPSNRWSLLSPDEFGDYVHGSWSDLSPMYNSRNFYASAVLADGRVFVAGGEYSDDKNKTIDLNGREGGWTNKCEIYNPLLDLWSSIPSPDKWGNIGDAPCCVLPDGRVILGIPYEPVKSDTRTAIYDPAEYDPAKAWSSSANKYDSSAEETWTLLPDNTILCAECDNHPSVEKYIISTDKWVKDKSTPVDLVQKLSKEIGPAILLPDKRVFAIGATGHTALYTMPLIADKPGTWIAGPDFPADTTGNPMESKDAPACLLPNGRVLCVAGPADDTKDGYKGPMYFFEFDGKSLIPVPVPKWMKTQLLYTAIPPLEPLAPFVGRMLLLPTGQVLFSFNSREILVYNPGGTPHPSWRPKITYLPSVSKFNGGRSYHLIGQQLNGLSQAVSYGDDASMATNYPLVQIKNISSGKVWYCRTFDHSTMGVATDKLAQSTNFDIPPGIEDGKAELCVIANGISSESIPIITREFRIPRVPRLAPTDVVIKVHFDDGKDIHMGGLVDGQLWVLTRHGFVPIGPWNPNDLVKRTQFSTPYSITVTPSSSVQPRGPSRQRRGDQK